MWASVSIFRLRKREKHIFLASYPTACNLVTVMTELPGYLSTTYMVDILKYAVCWTVFSYIDKLCYIPIPYHNRQKYIHIYSKLPSAWWQNYFISLTILYQFPVWYLWLAFCYFYLTLSMLVLISRCHLLPIPKYFKSYISNAWNQQLIHICLICYIPISNIQ